MKTYRITQSVNGSLVNTFAAESEEEAIELFQEWANSLDDGEFFRLVDPDILHPEVEEVTEITQ